MDYDVVPSPRYPTPDYAAFGSTLGNLFNNQRKAQSDKLALQQQQMQLDAANAIKSVPAFLANGQPNYAGQMAAMAGAGDTSAITRLGPLATETMPGSPSPIFGGAGGGAPAPAAQPQPSPTVGDLPPASAASGTTTRRPQPGYTVSTASDQGGGAFGSLPVPAKASVDTIVGNAISDPVQRAKVTANLARALGTRPDADLTPAQVARAQSAVAARYAPKSGGGTSWQDVQRDNAQGTANLPRVGAQGQAATAGAGGGTANLVGQIKKGISGVESGGKYDAIGPVTPSGDRAYGKYQVMGENVGPWTQEALGYAMTPQQFLRDQGAQEAVASTKIQELLAKGNSPQDVASEWLTGKPLAQGANLRDQNGTSGAQYASAVTRGIGGAGAPQGGQRQGSGGQPIVPQPPLPPGARNAQDGIMMIEREQARLAASPNPRDQAQIPILERYRQDLVGASENVKITPTEQIVDPVTGAIKAQGALAGGQGTMASDAVENAAQVYLDTGKLPPRMGGGMQGSANMNAVLSRAATLMQEQGIEPDSLAQRWQSFSAQGAGQSLLAKRTASLELAENEASALIPAVRDAAANVKSTDYPDINKVIQAGLMHTGDQNVVRLGIAVESLAQTYARVLSPSGAPTAADKANAHEIIAKYWSQGQIGAALDQMEKEIGRAKASLNTTRKEMGASPLKEDTPSSAPATATHGAPTPGTIEQGYRFKGGDPSKKENWEKV